MYLKHETLLKKVISNLLAKGFQPCDAWLQICNITTPQSLGHRVIWVELNYPLQH